MKLQTPRIHLAPPGESAPESGVEAEETELGRRKRLGSDPAYPAAPGVQLGEVTAPFVGCYSYLL